MSTDDMPPQPKTTQLPAADKNEILFAELKVLVSAGFTGLNERMDTFETNQKIQGGQIGVVEKEISLLWEWKSEVNERLKTNSQRAQATSSMDLDHEAKLGLVMGQLAEERAKREKLENESATKADIAKALDDAATVQTAAIVAGVKTIAETPTVKKLTGAILPVLLVAIAIIGLKLQASLSRLQAQPQTQMTTVQLAPAAASPDAGAPK